MSVIMSPNRYEGRRAPIRVIVVHTMEVSENDTRVAESVGNAFARTATRASAHVGVDTDSTVRYVADGDTAWAAPGANTDGLQLEIAGRAGQTTGDWTDPASKAILERAAQQVAQWCRTYGIPSQRLSDAELAGGQAKGIVGHADVSRVFKKSNHWDPGPNFPWAVFLSRVRAITAPRLPDTAPSRGQTRQPLPKPAPTSQLVVDGDLGPATIRAIQRWVGVDDDGALGPVTIRAVQAKVGVKQDGAWGGQTWAAINRITGEQPGGPGAIRVLQTYLNQQGA